jgi:hypothetical protein
MKSLLIKARGHTAAAETAAFPVFQYWQSNMNNVKMFQAHKEPIRKVSFR